MGTCWSSLLYFLKPRVPMMRNSRTPLSLGTKSRSIIRHRKRKNNLISGNIQCCQSCASAKKHCLPVKWWRASFGTGRDYCCAISCLPIQQSKATAIAARRWSFVTRFKTRGEARWRRERVCIRTILVRTSPMSKQIWSTNLDAILLHTHPIAQT